MKLWEKQAVKSISRVFLLLGALAAPLAAQDFPTLAGAILSSAPFENAQISVLFVSLPQGASVYAKNPDLALIPASNAKLATSAAALDILRPDFRFKTSLMIPEEDAAKAAVSALVWKGFGDPSISGRNRTSLYEIFEIWGSSLSAVGIKKIKRLVLDNRYFKEPAVVSSWPEDELSYWYAAQTSAISFNDNCVDLRFFPNAKAGRRPRITLEPDFGYIKIKNRAFTGPARSSFTLDYQRAPRTNKVAFTGSIAVDSPIRTDFVSVDRPAFFAADALKHIFIKKGIEIKKVLPWEKAHLKESGLIEVLAWQSEPLSSLVGVINKNSQNLYAEQVLKTMGKIQQGEGSFEAGLRAVRGFLKKAGLDDKEFVLADGSGLSEENRFSASGIVKLLSYMQKDPLFSIYHDSLAVPSPEKSMRKSLKNHPLAAHMRLKQGTVAHARNLSGYLRSRSGQLYAFSVLVNRDKLDRPAVDEAVDQLCGSAADRLP